jgi:hypothetical protein
MQKTLLNPIAIGGLGGSGTRLIASVLMNADIYIGSCLNKALDNLWFSTLFRRSETPELTDMEFGNLARLFINVMTERRPFSFEERAIIEKLSSEDRERGNDDSVRIGGESMLATVPQAANRGPWGWKEPNTHLVIDKWYSIYPDMKYIHVTRNGLDMAFSSNQNQLKLWGKHLLGSAHQVTPRNSLRFWCAVHRKLFALMPTMGSNFYLLRYDDFCSDPDTALESLLGFLGLRYPEEKKQILRELIVPPQSMGRRKSHSLDEFDTEDVEFVRSLGFEV